MQAYHEFLAVHLGKQMKEKRLDLKGKTKWMAEALGVTGNMYRRYEHGRSLCRADVLLNYETLLSEEELIAFVKDYRALRNRWKAQQEQQERLKAEETRAQRKRWKCSE